MEYVQLGRTGVKIAPLTLGTMNFGPWQEEQASYKVMDRALEHGLNLWDTANVYGFDKGKGLTEEIIGRWMKERGNRDQIVLATKLYGAMGDGPNDRGNSAFNIRQAVDASLKRLQTDRIDLIQMHHIDRTAPWEEVWQAFEVLVQQGKVLYVGSSNFAAWNIAQANEMARHRNFLGLVSDQSVYSLRNRHIELEVIPAAKAYGMASIPWSPLGGGMLAGIFSVKDGSVRRQREKLLEAAEPLRPQIEAYEQLCRDIGHDYADVALAWVCQQDGITAPIIGPRTIEQLDANVKSLDITLDDETPKKLDEIWPGPGNQAPEAYAW